MIVHERAQDFGPGQFVHTHYDEKRHGLALISGASRGTFTSATVIANKKFREVILSVNVDSAKPDNLGLVGLVSVDHKDEWTPWFRMLQWGLGGTESGVSESYQGKVLTELLRLNKACSRLRYRLAWRSENAQPLIRRLGLSLYDNGSSTAQEQFRPKAERLEVPFLSQQDVTRHEALRVCSPTCVAMVAAYYGRIVSLDELATVTYDAVHDLYGNWSLNVLAASRLGLSALVDRCDSLKPLEDAVAKRQPVITSVAYGEGELPGAPQSSSAGHLVVICGFTPAGNVWARDPAARGENIWTQYDREAFGKVWLGHGGVVYRIEPERGL